MDKTLHATVNRKLRPAFALMVTFSVLLVIIALTVVLLSYFKEVRQDTADTTAMIQADVYYADITNIFSRFKKKSQLFNQLYRFPVPLRSPDGRFSMMLRCQALSKGVNVNWLAMEEKASMREPYSVAQMVFDTLSQNYNLEDASRLQEMLAEETGGKEKFVKKEYSRLRQKNGIISYQQFAGVVSRYQLEVDDPAASRVPWKKYFTFSSNAKVIDAEYSSPELISLLFDIDLQTVQEWHGSLEKSSLSAFVQDNGGDYASKAKIIAGKKFLEDSECTVTFARSGKQYRFRFEYIQGEANILNFMEKTKELLLVHTAMESVTVLESVNVMLTPQFYTLKKEALPVKYAYQAKKIAPSLFDGLLEENASYEYTVYQEGDTWVFVAFDPEKITTFLESKGLAPQKVAKVFFAQQSLDAFTAPLALSDKEALVVVDETVVVVPSMALREEEQPTLAFGEHFTPEKGGVKLKSKEGAAVSLLTEKQSWSLAAIFLLFAGVFVLEGSRYGGDTKQSEEKLQTLYEEYPALQSTYTRQGITDKYRTIDKMERKKREAIKTFSGMIFKGVTLTALQMNEKSFKAQFSCVDEEVAKKVKALAKKAQYNTSKVKGSSDLSIEGTL